MARIVISCRSAHSQVTALAEVLLEGAAAVAGVQAELLAVDGDGALPDQAWAKIAAAEPKAPLAMKTGR